LYFHLFLYSILPIRNYFLDIYDGLLLSKYYPHRLRCGSV
jgi:hypothetical protein